MTITSSVPTPSFTDKGFVPPTQAQVLAGRIADLQAAFNNALNLDINNPSSLSTPQGQLASSESAIIAAANALFTVLANSVDPAIASGRMQDAIARIYFLERTPSQPTTVACLCSGLAGTVIPALALAQDGSGNTYYAVDGGTIPPAGYVTLSFANNVTGPIACPANTLTTIFAAIPGWDSINNAADGVLGNVVESRADFEARREASVSANSKGALVSIRGAVLQIPGVVDCFTAENYNAYQTVVNVKATASAHIIGTALTIASLTTGTIAIGQNVSCVGVADGTVITSGSGSSWVVTPSQTVPSTGSIAMTFGVVVLVPKSIYVAVVGGAQSDVAETIFTKKSPGCNYNGNTTVAVYDTSPPYSPPGIPYSVTYEIPDSITVYFAISITNTLLVPSNATAQVQAAVLAAFSGADGGTRARINATVLASRFYAGIVGLGAWAQLVSLEMGSSATAASTITASISGATMTVTGITPASSLAAGQIIAHSGIVEGTTIVAQLTGSAGSTGTYTVSPGGQTLGSTASIRAYNVTATSVTMLANQGPVTSANDITVTLV